MDQFDKFKDDFESIIIQKEYKMLTQEELTMIGAEGLSEEEYNAIRQTLISLSELDEEVPNPSVNLKLKLMSVFDEIPAQKSQIIRWPIWTSLSIAVAAMIALAFFLVNQPVERLNTKPQIAQDIHSKLNPTESVSQELTNSDLNKDTPFISTQKSAYPNHFIPDNVESMSTSDNVKVPNEQPSEIKTEAESVSQTSTSDESTSSMISSNSSVDIFAGKPASNFVWENSNTINTNSDATKNAAAKKAIKKSEASQLSYSLAESPELIYTTLTVY
jgi:hypothetical protein